MCLNIPIPFLQRTHLDQRIPAFKVKKKSLPKIKRKINSILRTIYSEIVKEMHWLSNHIECNASGAKVWEKTNFNNYEIKLILLINLEVKRNLGFQNVKVPLVEIGVNCLDENNDYKYITDLFVISDDFCFV